MWALLQPARITNKVKKAMNRVLGGVLDNGPNIDPFPTSKEVWVTEGIFFNGVGWCDLGSYKFFFIFGIFLLYLF
jgi:hypothetical protein